MTDYITTNKGRKIPVDEFYAMTKVQQYLLLREYRHSEATKQKLSASLKGRTSPTKGLKMTAESNAKRSKALKGVLPTKATVNTWSIEGKSTGWWAKKLNCSRDAIRMHWKKYGHFNNIKKSKYVRKDLKND
tara:strand:+ start:582 stop:977 length:396 start_codon:yes stop_codon:yes gene_type:complete